MKLLFEYVGKQVFADYGIRIPQGKVATRPEEAEKIAREIGGPVVVKSQVTIGKRGKAGGIKFADNPGEAKRAADEILGLDIRGYTVGRVLVEEKIAIDHEFYFSLAVDSSAKRPVLIASTEGGMDIEEVPEDKIVKIHLDIGHGIKPYLARDICRRLGLEGPLAKEFSDLMIKAYKIYREKDAELVEINPLVASGEKFIAADAKLGIDEEALFRQKDLEYYEERTPIEQKAHELGLSYVELGGNIAIMANGAGLTMGAIDIIHEYGGSPSNFLDAGGGTGMETTAKALELLISTNPKVIFINIFGGITRCDDVANAFAKVKKSRTIDVPVVFRLVGTNEEEGLRILRENGMEAYKLMHEAAAKAVELAKDQAN